MTVGGGAGGGGVNIHSVIKLMHMAVRFLDPAPVEGVHFKAPVRQIKAHAHNASERDLALAPILDNAAAADDITGREHGVVQVKLRCAALFTQMHPERFGITKAVVGARQRFRRKAALVLFPVAEHKVVGIAAVLQLHLKGALTIVSPAGTRPFKTHGVKAVFAAAAAVHYAAAPLNVVLNTKQRCILALHPLAVVYMLKMPKLAYAEKVARVFRGQIEYSVVKFYTHCHHSRSDMVLLYHVPCFAATYCQGL